MKKISKNLNAADLMFSVMDGILGNPGIDESRKAALNTKVGDIVVDTVCAYDTGVWETGINRGYWIIVEQYENKKKAELGHKKWVKKIKENKDCKLKDINLFNI